MAWLLENLATILVGLALAALLGGIILHMLRQRKRGQTSCGCGCSNCAMRGECHAARAKNKEE